MFKKRIWLGITLSIILLVFSMNGFTAYYKYTQESGTNFYVGIADKADALEDTNEMRQIIDDLGALLGHSLRNDLYPKDESTGGYLGRLNYGVDDSKPADPVVNDMYLATDTTKIYKCFVAGNWVQIYPEGGASTFLELIDTPGTYDTGKYAKSTADGVIWDDPAGAGDMTKAVYDTNTNNIVDKAETVDDGVNNASAADLEDAVTKKHTKNTDTQFDFYNALADDHDWSGDKDTQLVGESVAFGDLLYFDWTVKRWKKSDADAAATMPGLRIALESKGDGEACLMLVKGYIRGDNEFDFGASMVYASVTPGAMSSIAPTETGDQIQRVGVAKSADILFFDPSIDVGEI